MAMFGKSGSIAGFNPSNPSFTDKLGLAGDILTGNPVTKTRLDEDFAFNQAQYASQHPSPMNVGGNLVQYDPMTGGIQTLYSAPKELTGFAGELQAAGFDPNSAEFRRYAQQHAINAATAPPIVQHNQDGTTTLYQAGMIPRTPTDAPAVGSVVADPRKAGGAAPAMGPGGFPLHPRGY